MPTHLKRHLSLEETSNMEKGLDHTDNRYIVWKFGRTSHFTFGLLSGIYSNYHSDDGLVTEQLWIVDWVGRLKVEFGNFSVPGDSGSLIWDNKGYVRGLLWGGMVGTTNHFAMPMQHVLADIKEVCGAKDVQLVVRTEDKT
jgi:hypothetical protein